MRQELPLEFMLTLLKCLLQVPAHPAVVWVRLHESNISGNTTESGDCIYCNLLCSAHI